MRRPIAALAALVAVTMLAVTAIAVPVAAATSRPSTSRPSTSRPSARIQSVAGVTIVAPATARRGLATAVTVTLPASVAAIDGRVLFSPRSMELLGVATIGGGTGMMPVAYRGGAAFGAYDLQPTSGRVRLQLVLVPHVSGTLDVRVVIDSTADRFGRRTTTGAGLDVVTGVRVGRTGSTRSAPAANAGPRPTAAATAPRELVPDGRFTARDLDTARLDWSQAREKRHVCGAGIGDANGDGCTDIVDVQLTKANLGRPTAFQKPARRPRTGLATIGHTFTVRSTADTPDASIGDGVCADDQGRCTLRAAIGEADSSSGDDRIEFALSGSAPVTIHVAGRLPAITSRGGTLTIDGYTQPGAKVNSAATGDNAVPGVELVGDGPAAMDVLFRVTSAGNTIRGLVIQGVWRGIVLDGTGATGNRIVGNWLGFTRTGGNPAADGQYGVLLNTGANHNIVGTPDLADRNVLGNWGTGVNHYGPGTDANVTQDNLFCIQPDGGIATCHIGVDHNFGPKSNILGGDGQNERNVIGPTINQGIEYSHGWDPSLPYGTDTADTYRIRDNIATGNWVGFKANGAFDPAYRSGLAFSDADNGNGINCYDGSLDNIIQRNYVTSVYDGIQVMVKTSTGDIVRGNIIGQSPLGEAAPLNGWGIIVREGAKNDVVTGNLIRNAGKGGIGLLNTNNKGGAQPPATSIRLSRNIIKDTDGPAIDLFGVAGPDPNDVGDTDTGANMLLNTPVISAVTTSSASGTAAAGATVEVYKASRGVGAYGLPVAFKGDTTVAGDGTWQVALSGMVPGDRVTALQIAPDGNTSELSMNVPIPIAAGGTAAKDAFARTIDSGWGAAAVGGPWNVSGDGFHVSGGVGWIYVPAAGTREASLAISLANVAITGRVTNAGMPQGGSATIGAEARVKGGDAYRAAIRVTAAGKVSVQLLKVVAGTETAISSEVAAGLTISNGVSLRFRFVVVGSQLKLRIWKAGATEPAAWKVTAHDGSIAAAGGVGFFARTAASVTNPPIPWTVDDLEARRPG